MSDPDMKDTCAVCGVCFGAHRYTDAACPLGYMRGFEDHLKFRHFRQDATSPRGPAENEYLVSATVQMLVKATSAENAALRAQIHLVEASRVDYANDPMNGVVIDAVEPWTEEDL